MTGKVTGQGHLDTFTGFFKKKVGEAVEAVMGTAVKVDEVVYRQQVPADRWYLDNKADFKTTKEELQARGWAILYTLEGAARAAVEGICFLFAKYVSNTKEGVDKYEAVLNVQIKSLVYTAWAIINPVGQKINTQEEFKKGHFPVGCAAEDFRWGDRYAGTLTIPLSFDYNWHPKA